MSSGTGRITRISGGLDLQHTAGIFGFKTETVTADHTIDNNDSGTWFVANGAGIVNFTLPAPSATANKGHFWIFQNKGAVGMGVVANANLVCLNNAAATSVTYVTPNEIIGAMCAVICDGTLTIFWNLGQGHSLLLRVRAKTGSGEANKPMAITGLRGKGNSNQLYWEWVCNVVKNYSVIPALV